MEYIMHTLMTLKTRSLMLDIIINFVYIFSFNHIINSSNRNYVTCIHISQSTENSQQMSLEFSVKFTTYMLI